MLVPKSNLVTSGQVRRSGGGAVYDAASFDDALATVLADGTALGARGQAWVREECSWHAFDERLERLVALAASAPVSNDVSRRSLV